MQIPLLYQIYKYYIKYDHFAIKESMPNAKGVDCVGKGSLS